MTYFKIGDKDCSAYVNKLKVTKDHIYNALTTAAGNTMVKYINSKRVIEVGIIPLEDDVMKTIQEAIDKLKISISFRDPKTNILAEDVVCILPSNNVEYYTIRADKVQYKAFTLIFQEL